MATSVLASAVVDASASRCWSAIRDFVLLARCMRGVASSQLVSGASSTEIGAVREVRWADGSRRLYTLVGLNDYAELELCYTLVSAEPAHETAGAETRITVRGITEDDGARALVSWEVFYAAGTPGELLRYEQKALEQNLRDLRRSLLAAGGGGGGGGGDAESPEDVLQHIHQGPSCRVVWLMRELGRPLAVCEHRPDLRASCTTMPTTRGGLMTAFTDARTGLVLLESGAVVSLLLERYDRYGLLSPPLGDTRARALYHQAFFLSASTCDHVLLVAYQARFVEGTDDDDDDNASAMTSSMTASTSSTSAALAERRRQWREEVVPALERVLADAGGDRYVCGAQFTAADIMLGWSLFLADMLGWLQSSKPLTAYLARLQSRPHWPFVFSS